jgi:hypothetical protein
MGLAPLAAAANDTPLRTLGVAGKFRGNSVRVDEGDADDDDERNAEYSVVAGGLFAVPGNKPTAE